jgi:hypothetical protein
LQTAAFGERARPATLTIVAVATRQTPATRAKDSDREQTCRALDDALTDGELSMEEHRQRISAATNAVTLGELQALVADLQSAPAPVQPAAPVSVPKISGWGVTAAALVVAMLLGVGIGWGLYGHTSSPLSFTSDRADPGAKPDGIAPTVLTPPKHLQSLGGLTGLMDQTRKRFGDAMGFRLVVYPDYAVMDRADPSQDRRQLSYTYRGGWGNPSSSAKTSDVVAVDLSRFDPHVVVGILRGAPQTLGIKQADVKSTYLIVEPSRDPTTPDALSLSAYVSTDYGSGYIVFAGDGTVNQLYYPS